MCQDTCALSGDGAVPVGLEQLSQAARDMAYGPGTMTREEFLDRRGRVVAEGSLAERFRKREVVCKRNTFETTCNALTWNMVAGTWIPDPMGW